MIEVLESSSFSVHPLGGKLVYMDGGMFPREMRLLTITLINYEKKGLIIIWKIKLKGMRPAKTPKYGEKRRGREGGYRIS